MLKLVFPTQYLVNQLMVLTKLAQKHCWEDAQSWLDFDDLDLIFKVMSP